MMASSSPAGVEGSDLSSINTMMSAVMAVGSVAENGGSPPRIKSPSKAPGPNRIGRRNQETKEEKSSYSCPLCEKLCSTQHQLTMHIRQHNTDTGGADHSCSICGKSLSSASSLDRHMLVHSGERPYKCTVCGQSFTTNGNMHRHMKIHEKDPTGATASAPPSPLKRRRLSSKRKLSHDAESEKEDLVSKKTLDDGSVDLEKAGDELLHCPICFKEFVCRYSLESHVDAHSENPLRCDVCCVTFRTHRGLLRHNALVHKQLPRDAAGRPFIQNNPAIPAGFHDLGFTDFSCRKFPRISQAWCETNLRRCISEQHRCVCDTCDKAFPMPAALTLHAQTHAAPAPARSPPADAPDQKLFLALLGLQHTREVGPAPAEELPPDDNQAIQQQALRGPLPPEPGCPAVLGLSATALGGPLAVLPFQKGFLLQPDSGIVVKPVSSESAVELADIQQILQMAAAAPPHLGLPPLSKAPAAPLQTIFKHMPPLKPKPLVTPRTLVAASTPPPLVSAQQTSPGCTSPSLPPPPLKLLRGAVEAASQAHLLQSKSGAPAAPLFLPAPRSEPPGPADVQAQLEQDGLLEALLPLGVEAKIKQEVTEAELKAIMVGPGGKKAPAVRKVLYPCRFCNQVFAFSGVLRAHVRSHLGISPYQCNICDYIAADKAALIRHLRTHSGERPYICRICQYPFTVKANCERHLRKKHLKATRKDIEKNIEYVTSSAAELVDAFCAPDTVCRLCGQDLQHHRALRVHMRTHCARPRKPFECRECSAAFTARRNCVHHVLKQHLHVPESDIDAYVLAADAAPGPASASERKPLAAFLEPHNGFLHAAGAAPLPHVTVKLEPAGGFPVHLSEPLDFSQKGLALVHVKQESPGVFLSAGPAPYDCSMEPIDLSVPKSLRRGDKETPVLAEGKKPAQDADGTEPAAAPPPAPAATAGSGAVPEKPKPPGGPSAASAPDGGPTQALQGPVRLAVPIYPSTLVSGAGLLGGPALLRPLRPKPPLLLPKPPASEELPPLASIAQIISSVSSAPTLLRAKVTDPGPGLATADSSGVPKAATSPAECSDPPPAPPVASSPEPSSPPDLGPAGMSKKRGRKRALRSRPRAPSGGLDLDSSGEFASVEKMLATTDSHRFTPFLQTAQDGPQQDASGEEQPGLLDDKAQQGRPAPSPGCPQRLSCPHCPRVFPWASSLQRHLLTHTGQKPFPCQTCDAFFSTKSNCERHQLRRHGLGACSPRRNGLLARRAERGGAAPDSTDSQSDAETAAATGGLVLDLTSKEKELLPSPEAGGHPAEEDEEEAEEEEEDGEDAAAVESPGPGDGCGAEGKDADGPESDTVSNKSLDLNLASTLMGFKLGTGPPEQKQACGVCGKTFKFLGTLSRHRKAHEHGDILDEAQGAGGPQEGSPAAAPEPKELPAEPLEAPAEKQGEEGEGPSDGEAERLAERSGGGGAAGLAASKADKRKKVCSVCSKRFWSLQDLTRHMRSHTGERPYKCQTCARTFTLKHSLVRHQRVHQKARHARPQGKDSDRDEAAGEDSGSESTHSGTHPPSESEAVGPPEDGAGRTAGGGQAEADEPQPESPTPALEPQEPRGRRPGPPPDGSPPPGLE